MSSRLAAVASVALLLGSAWTSPLVAQDIVGSWQLTWEGADGPSRWTMTLERVDGEIVGSMRWAAAPPGMDIGGMEVRNVVVDGADFSFEAVLTVNERELARAYRGTMDGETMRGTISPDTPFTGRRLPGR